MTRAAVLPVARTMTTAAELRAAKRAALPTELARLRFDAGLTIREVCDACGISSISLLSNWENGRCRPNMRYSLALMAFYADTQNAPQPRKPDLRGQSDRTLGTDTSNTAEGHYSASQPVARWQPFMGAKR